MVLNLEVFRSLGEGVLGFFECYFLLDEKENIDVAQRVFASATNKYKYGASSNMELTNASNDLISAQSNYIQAVLSLVNAQVELEKFLNN